MTLIPVIARSKATWQSTPTLSLRGAQRRGNPYPPVIARSKATWQSTPTLSLRGAKRRGNPYPPRHCEERSDVAIHTHPVIARSAATWQSIFQAVPDARWIASPLARNDGGAARNDGRVLAMTVGTRNDPNSCHCEEQSDVAIHTHPVIARSKATWQSIFQAVPDARWIASPSARNDSGSVCQHEPVSVNFELT